MFLNIIRGNNNVPISENSHTTSVAKIQVSMPEMLIPLETRVVMIKLISVVTNATPPLKAGTFVMAIFVISGSSTNCATVYTTIATIKAVPLILKPLSNIDAKNNPSAFAKRFNTIWASSLIILLSYAIHEKST